VEGVDRFLGDRAVADREAVDAAGLEGLQVGVAEVAGD
jgi:hypothetical protein